jgi:CheY-like chemotaxis protein
MSDTYVDIPHGEPQPAEQARDESAGFTNQFLAVLAHELRTPLAPILSAAGILRSHPDPVVVRCCNVIARQTTFMAHLLDDLLEITRISQGRLALQPRRVLLQDVIDQALETVRPLIDRHGHTLTIAAVTEPLHLDADAARLTQALVSLLSNAARFTSRGGEISLCVVGGEGMVTVTVRDSGPGMPSDQLDRVFDLFAPGDCIAAAPGEGLGVGLWVTRQLVEMHGGTIKVRSDGPGKGSAFTIRLPLAAREVATVADAAASADAAVAGHAVRRRRVLVVDDSVDAADMMAVLLADAGCEVCTAYNGTEARQAAGLFEPEIVLLDLSMPGTDGFAVAEYIRRQPWASATVLAAITGLGQAEDRRRTRAAGFDVHLVKPVGPDALMRLTSARREPEI